MKQAPVEPRGGRPNGAAKKREAHHHQRQNNAQAHANPSQGPQMGTNIESRLSRENSPDATEKRLPIQRPSAGASPQFFEETHLAFDVVTQHVAVPAKV